MEVFVKIKVRKDTFYFGIELPLRINYHIVCKLLAKVLGLFLPLFTTFALYSTFERCFVIVFKRYLIFFRYDFN